jgi:hypothetical protein
VTENVGDCEEKVGDHADRLSLPVVRLGRGPEQGVERVLAERRKEAIADLKKQNIYSYAIQKKPSQHGAERT